MAWNWSKINSLLPKPVDARFHKIQLLVCGDPNLPCWLATSYGMFTIRTSYDVNFNDEEVQQDVVLFKFHA